MAVAEETSILAGLSVVVDAAQLDVESCGKCGLDDSSVR
jgi:hypothetical protein